MAADNALRTLLSEPVAQSTPELPPDAELAAEERTEAARLMRVNHAGEIAAQALYHGQALAARNDATRRLLEQSAAEEGDHLAWCAMRVRELGSHTSRLAPLWYAGSFAVGLAAALAGDRISLGFVRETEKQVEGHLSGHLQRLPANDRRSRAIVERMRADETRHGQGAADAGGVELPRPIPQLMHAASQVMTRTAHWI